jgi:peptide/nickel transport system permease protein
VFAFIIRRLFATVLLLVLVSFITFLIFFEVPKLAGQTSYALATQYAGRSPSPSVVHAVEQQLGLDQPWWEQFGKFIWGIVAGRHYNSGPGQGVYCPPPCMGYSFKNQLEVWPQIYRDLPVTVSLAIGAAVLWLIGGIAIGIISALRRGHPVDRIAMIIALAGVSLPIFFTGQILQTVFVYGHPFTLFTAITYVSPWQNPLQWAQNLFLPWVALAFLYAALYARLTRAGMLETMTEDYIRTARAKGLPERTVIFKHGLRAALTPIVTIFGMDLGLLLGGAIITEYTFGLSGIGEFTVLAINDQDLTEIMGVTLVATFFVVIANLVVDILYAYIDPRVKLA